MILDKAKKIEEEFNDLTAQLSQPEISSNPKKLQTLSKKQADLEEIIQKINKYKEALDKRDPFKAVIMDLTVPGGMGGQEAVRIIKAGDPNVKAIVSSGYSNDPIMSEYEKYGFSGVVAKPYRIEEMQKVLEDVLGK